MPNFVKLLTVVLAMLFGSALGASAQSSALNTTLPPDQSISLEGDVSPEQLTELVARMSDDDLRAFVIEQLKMLVASGSDASEAPSTLIDRATILWATFTDPILTAIVRLPVLFERQAEAFSVFVQTQGGSAGTFTLFGLMALIFAIGYGAERATRWYLGRSLDVAAQEGEQSLLASIKYLFGRLVREIVGLVVFIVVVRIVGRLALDATQLLFAAPFFSYLILLPRVGAALSRFIMAPNRPDLRLVTVSDRWARFIHVNTVGLMLLAGFNVFALDFSFNNGIAPGETRLGFWIDGAVYLYIIIVAWVGRDGLQDMMRGSDPDRTAYDEWIARAYPGFAILVAAIMWVIVTILMGMNQLAQVLEGAQYVTMFWLLMAPALDTAIRGLVRHTVPPMIGEGPLAEKAYLSNKRSMIRIGRVLVGGLVVLIIANAWDVSLLQATGTQDGTGDNILAFLLTGIIGYIAYEGVSIWVNRLLAREKTDAGVSEETDAGEIGGAGASRLSTVLPLLEITSKVIIAVVFTLLAIGNLGIDITPLLAGAGIAGLAIGFGAQKLVTDIVSGVFFLVDDAFRLGEYVEIGGTMGSVEKISIRSMRLRHHNGPVHTIPYGEIPQLTNFSRDWVIMKMKFMVNFDTDPNRVKRIFKKIGAEMLEHPELGEDFLQPFKSQGVMDIDDVGMIIRGKFMAKPGKQFMIRKEIYNRVKAEFEANGIEFARREVRVDIPGLDHGRDLSPEEEASVTAAATSAAQQAIQADTDPESGKK
ncbi:Moderate conductance mechanosensitive channel YbiO precursor [Roseovarius litorisediminis]|uniref:Moderate conductance mechanosensitive channel YbiO n=1 Tax=Roseovarius litorisediminis TaxID=1312363 RepID=A0A1Y5R5F3_9RHOB|nr:mechanosensitive ion channel family protein [Roseovarius litorisediminis]SLN09515.1 Moderate conductance mechanosensitive channel YbiO precursor [Roseovarius litorisediminis]